MSNGIITGVDTVIAAMGKAIREAPPKIADGLLKCGHIVLRKANYYVPKDTRALEISGKVEVSGSGLNAVVRVVFGSPLAYYALYVHENLFVYHESPTCAKYLERAQRETRGTCTSLMKRVLTNETGYIRDGEYVE